MRKVCMAHELSSTPKLDFDDVLLVPSESSKFQSRNSPDLQLYSQTFKNMNGLDTVGLIAANMDGVGTIEVAKVLSEHKVLTALHKHYPVDRLVGFFSDNPGVSNYCFYSMGMTQADLKKFQIFLTNYKPTNHHVPLKVCIDVANGYMKHFHEFCSYIRTLAPNALIMAGNVVEPYGVTTLHDYGVDMVKVGIGPSAVCMTRAVTGVGYPQFSAINDIYKKSNTSVMCSDGGCKQPGDIVKAFAAGATTVMLGSMLSGTDEGGGTIVEIDGKKFVEFYGMSSHTAQKKHFDGTLATYRSSEGRTVLVPYKGSVETIITHILGGIRSACTYLNCTTVDELVESSYVIVKSGSGLNKMFEATTIGY